MLLSSLTPKRIDVETLVRWCTDRTIGRNQADWDAYNIVQILKGNAFNGYLYFKVGAYARKINSSNAQVCIDEILRLCAEHIRQMSSAGVTIVPVPNSNATPQNLEFRTLELARGIKRYLPDQYRAKPVLVWKEAQKKASKGERSRNWNQHLSNLAISATTRKPIILFDDVVTTGSQLYASKLKLESCGHKVVGLVAVASVLEHDGVTHSSEPGWERHYRTFYS